MKIDKKTAKLLYQIIDPVKAAQHVYTREESDTICKAGEILVALLREYAEDKRAGRTSIELSAAKFSEHVIKKYRNEIIKKDILKDNGLRFNL